MKIIISGYGKMGRMIEKVLAQRGIPLALASEDICAVDPALAAECVCIDFTAPESFRANYPFIAAHFKAAVIGTTGWNDIAPAVKAEFLRCGTPMIYASNFSIGVNVLFAAVRTASRLLSGQGYQPYIEEKHHIHKLDAPSGTAKSLSSIVEEAFGLDAPVQTASIRAGEIPGIHSVQFEGVCDRLTFTHEAFSREGFAHGAVEAALMTEGLEGVHDFTELFAAKLQGK